MHPDSHAASADVPVPLLTALQAEARRDASAIGINSTPTVTVAGVPLRSPDLESVRAAIEVALGTETNATGDDVAPAEDGQRAVQGSREALGCPH